MDERDATSRATKIGASGGSSAQARADRCERQVPDVHQHVAQWINRRDGNPSSTASRGIVSGNVEVGVSIDYGKHILQGDFIGVDASEQLPWETGARNKQALEFLSARAAMPSSVAGPQARAM
jgi:hypothetical protein